ncbi:hypothetical protein BOTBODRAFT_56137 [Botryobasidium botryosum FD-172 SS1]|uniref:Uncharacterized protein n=1 Tax=Botryobasidium botryosum (strain FD-172 SS1) TaxID=930990 RepID=A0A067MP24_BOTB1|nr:hypothetical protein BOTBODRAFT_56137 [Botryobasidium botryosum FD-172 SS1]
MDGRSCEAWVGSSLALYLADWCGVQSATRNEINVGPMVRVLSLEKWSFYIQQHNEEFKSRRAYLVSHGTL